MKKERNRDKRNHIEVLTEEQSRLLPVLGAHSELKPAPRKKKKKNISQDIRRYQ